MAIRYLTRIKSVKLKLIFSRTGRKKVPFYKLIVVTGQNNKFVDYLGFYKILPVQHNKFRYKVFVINKLKLLKYLSKGLVPSVYVFRFLKKLQIF